MFESEAGRRTLSTLSPCANEWVLAGEELRLHYVGVYVQKEDAPRLRFRLTALGEGGPANNGVLNYIQQLNPKICLTEPKDAPLPR